MRPVFDPTGGPDVLVEKMVGKAYDTVRRVSLSLPEIKRLDGVLEEIPDLAVSVVEQAIAKQLPTVLDAVDTKADTAVGEYLREAVPPIMASIQEKADDIDIVVASVEATAYAANASAEQAGTSASISGQQAVMAGGSAVSASQAAASANLAADAAMLGNTIYQSTAAALGNGVAGYSSLQGGSGGTNGTFPLVFTGGTPVIAPSGYFVVSGGSVVQVVIKTTGYYSAGTPTLSFTGSAGLTGASATAVMAPNVPAGAFFSVPSDDNKEYLILYKNNAGAPLEVKRYPSAKMLEEISGNFEEIDARSGVLFGLLDIAGALGMAMTADGKLNLGEFKDVVAHILALEAKAPEQRTDRSGNLASFVDLANAVAVAIEEDGSLINKGRNLLKEIDDLRAGIANSKWITPAKDFITLGDSLSDSSYQPFLKELLPDRNIYVGALSGKKSGQIARLQGGIAPMLTIADNIIPASGSVSVTVDVPFLNNYLKVSGHLYGVHGTLSAVNNAHYFTRSFPGIPVVIDPITPFVQSTTDTNHAYRTAIIWAGNNDTSALYRAEVDSNVQRMVDYLRPVDKHFIVIGMAIAAYSDRLIGTPYYADTMALHKKWRERWPDNFIDITPILQRNYDPSNPTDVQNVLDGCTPSSLRQPNDMVHLNNAGQTIVAHTIYNHTIQRGW